MSRKQMQVMPIGKQQKEKKVPNLQEKTSVHILHQFGIKQLIG